MAAEEEIDEFLDEEQLDAIVIPGQEHITSVSYIDSSLRFKGFSP